MLEPIKSAVQAGGGGKPAAIVITGSKQGITKPARETLATMHQKPQ